MGILQYWCVLLNSAQLFAFAEYEGRVGVASSLTACSGLFGWDVPRRCSLYLVFLLPLFHISFQFGGASSGVVMNHFSGPSSLLQLLLWKFVLRVEYAGRGKTLGYCWDFLFFLITERWGGSYETSMGTA